MYCKNSTGQKIGKDSPSTNLISRAKPLRVEVLADLLQTLAMRRERAKHAPIKALNTVDVRKAVKGGTESHGVV